MTDPTTITPVEVAAIMDRAVAAYWLHKRRSEIAKQAWARRRKGKAA